MELYEESTLSKKLKRRIQELCGFNELDREQRLTRAHEILNSTELKQEICHKILGTTFKDINKAMQSIIDERQLTPIQEEEIELRESHPEKYEAQVDLELEFKINKKAADPKKSAGYGTYTREQVAELLAASEAPYVAPEPMERRDYPTYTREQVQELMKDHFEYLEREKAKKEERARWDSQKTSESGLKTGNTMKPSKSTKA